MPIISMFYGIIVSMYYFKNREQKSPHIHVRYQKREAIVSIPKGKVFAGGLPNSKMKLVHAWIEIHQDELMANWELAVNGQDLFKIDPLR